MAPPGPGAARLVEAGAPEPDDSDADPDASEPAAGASESAEPQASVPASSAAEPATTRTSIIFDILFDIFFSGLCSIVYIRITKIYYCI